ncbi:hypothetical protein DPEC_G00139900 [Dallia pectoralis]|uniref:Uncharacterized protein n=1 Tax=Dallia pectoralis TaxID=75939 RepID=A0ACC2GM19_DALPE|nr:hypothetical protein DPEC_G00139900 [Dallia pectoralis]
MDGWFHKAGVVDAHLWPVPGSLSSLLHLRNRQRQPLPASMAGTLPDPTMQGSSVLMPMERQMSMGSMMGMQGPSHPNSCSSSPHGPSMHSEAKLLVNGLFPAPPFSSRGLIVIMSSGRAGGGEPEAVAEEVPGALTHALVRTDGSFGGCQRRRRRRHQQNVINVRSPDGTEST